MMHVTPRPVPHLAAEECRQRLGYSRQWIRSFQPQTPGQARFRNRLETLADELEIGLLPGLSRPSLRPGERLANELLWLLLYTASGLLRHDEDEEEEVLPAVAPETFQTLDQIYDLLADLDPPDGVACRYRMLLTMILKQVEILLSLGVPDSVGECFGIVDRVFDALGSRASAPPNPRRNPCKTPSNIHSSAA